MVNRQSQILRDIAALGLIMLVPFLLSACASQKDSDAKTAAIERVEEVDEHVRGFTDTFISRVALHYDQIALNAKNPAERTWCYSISWARDLRR